MGKLLSILEVFALKNDVKCVRGVVEVYLNSVYFFDWLERKVLDIVFFTIKESV